MKRGIVPVCVSAGLALSIALAHADGDDLTKVARSCPAAAEWIRAQRASGAAIRHDDAHAPAIPALRGELDRRASSDQQARDAWMAAGLHPNDKYAQATRKIDAANTAWLKGVVARSGFPAPAQVGMNGVSEAWLLVQHADQDIAFQSRVLDMLQPRVQDGSVPARDVAMLVDRVRVNQGKPQLYGSQFGGDASKPQSLHPSPIEDEAHVDERRARMGLMPLNDYACALRATYAAEPAQK